ncbi:hypothetical protein TRIUR3_11919 [Triticum urartu]|uniref:Uncharacterized protein n=1 Tax=Triticum urartu TaxID=4572 RepID=M7ZNU2_TRIUA|nr:hypothetical protein TRIUR3_11919 [Triticum urartu]
MSGRRDPCRLSTKVMPDMEVVRMMNFFSNCKLSETEWRFDSARAHVRRLGSEVQIDQAERIRLYQAEEINSICMYYINNEPENQQRLNHLGRACARPAYPSAAGVRRSGCPTTTTGARRRTGRRCLLLSCAPTHSTTSTRTARRQRVHAPTKDAGTAPRRGLARCVHSRDARPRRMSLAPCVHNPLPSLPPGRESVHLTSTRRRPKACGRDVDEAIFMNLVVGESQKRTGRSTWYKLPWRPRTALEEAATRT